ncbi:hypothetical protein G7074_02085 [Pedobacter sp. HDW13]|uniref:hypothetical protein n=1 Tax=Pedobacter sp. HDW13 TaxID=2714940 RepID=UPI00140D8989|nr:hypothetical protein [Pedobacter sp. HDW13]QIL38169.1 hypothetical protein G7074_02085 [Pedobacter sp. HDW13]
MKKTNMKGLLCLVLLLGIASLVNSCKRGFELEKNTPLAISQTILNAKSHVDSLISLQGPNGYIKKMGFEINWNNATIDSAGNVRVPMLFDLSKFKPKDGKQITIPETKTVYELFIKKDNGGREVSIMQFMNLKGKYYPLRFNLNGAELTKLGSSIAAKVLSSKSKQMQLGKGALPAFDKTMITESGFMELVQGMYGQSYLAAIIYECPLGTMFEPTTCLCDFAENVVNGAFYPEIFMIIASSPGVYQVVPYPFSFHPSEITADPEYPEEPIGGGTGNVDCAGVKGGTAYVSDCGCIGGTTGISNCYTECGPNTNVTITWNAANSSTNSSTATSTTVETPFVVEYEACADNANAVWRLRVKSITGGVNITIGNGSMRDPFANPPVNQAEAYAAVTEMKAHYTNGTRGLWFTNAAIMAHENYHYSEWKCSSEKYWPAVETDLENLTVPLSSYSNASSALTALLALGAATKIDNFKNQARSYWFSLSDGPSSQVMAAGQLVLNGAILHVQHLASINGWIVPSGTDSPSTGSSPCYVP